MKKRWRFIRRAIALSLTYTVAVLCLSFPLTGITAHAATGEAADTTTGDINILSARMATGYTVGGILYSKTDSQYGFYIQFRSYTAEETAANAKLYNVMTRNAYWYVSSYQKPYSCRVNVSEHGNHYGTYTTEVWKMYDDGTSKKIDTVSVYVSPISYTYSYGIHSASTTVVTLNYANAMGYHAAHQYWIGGLLSASQCQSRLASMAEFTGDEISVPVTSSDKLGQYFTVYSVDTAGYYYAYHFEVSSSYNGDLTIGVTQSNTDASASPVVQAVATCVNSDPNYTFGDDYKAYDTIDVWDSAVQDSTNPVPGSIETEYKCEANTNSLNSLFCRSGFIHDWQIGDSYYVGYWYKISSGKGLNTSLLQLSGFAADWSSTNEIYSATESAKKLIPDGQWHYNYQIVQYNATIQDVGQYYMLMNTTSDYDLKIAGLHAARIPAGSDISSGIVREAWAYGDQSVSYFSGGGGNPFSGHSFTVKQNGIVTVYAKSANGQETVRTYTVSNYDPAVGDVTPPTGTYKLSATGWTTQPVTVYVSASDTGSGVQSITDPAGNVTYGTACSYTVSANGSYTFKLADKAGNTTGYTVPVTNIDRSVDVTYTGSAAYTVDPNHTGSPFSAQDITLTNNNPHVAVRVTLQGLTSQLSGTNGFSLGVQVVETAAGDDTWAEIDNGSVQAAGSVPAVLGILSPGGTGHIRLVGSLTSIRWPQACTDSGNIQFQFTAVDP